MLNRLERCEGAFIGHAIASQYDASMFMTLNVCDSLLEQKNFQGQDIFARHLYLYHTKNCEIGEVTKYIYQIAMEKLQKKNDLKLEDFRFDEKTIEEIVELAHKKSNGHTAGCGPAQRSYPIAFCPFIDDDDIFDLCMAEAKLTHFSPLAGQVAGIVNLICRSLLQNENWTTAVRSAFTTPNLHEDVQAVLTRHPRFPNPAVQTHAAYAPTVLNAALYAINRATNPAQAIEQAKLIGQQYCTAIVGILAGARWAIPLELYKDKLNDSNLRTVREAASKLSNLAKIKPDSPSA